MNIINITVCKVKAVAYKVELDLHYFKAIRNLLKKGDYISQCMRPCTSTITNIYPSTLLRTLGTGITTTRTGTTTIRTTTTLCSSSGIR